MNIRVNGRLLSSVAIVAVVQLSTPAFAQTADERESQATAEGGIAEIVVTANKREESAQKVPVAISVYSDEMLEQRGVQDISRLELTTPGLTFAQRGNDFKPTIRGANSENTFRDNPPPIGFFVDGIYKPTASSQSGAFLDVSRVEVLKGPQGTLFGRNTLGGTINVITNKPRLGEFDFSIDTGVSNYAGLKAEAMVNVPVGNSMALRLAGSRARRDGYVRNLGPGEDLGAQDDLSIRASLLFEPSDAFSATLAGYMYHSKGSSLGSFGYQCRGTLRDPATGRTSNMGVYDPVCPRAGSLGAPADPGPWEVYRDSPYGRNLKDQVISLDMQYDAGGVTLRSLTSYTDFENYSEADADYSSNHFQIESYTEYMTAFTQEFQILSPDSGPLKWVAGLYFSDQQSDQSYRKSAFTGEISNAGLRLPDNGGCAGQVYATAPDPGTPVCPAFRDNGQPGAKTYGAFAQATYSLTDTFRITAGARYTKDDKSFKTIFDQAQGRTTEHASFEKATWRAGLEADLSSRNMAYATVSTGFLSGGYNTDRSTFRPQSVTAYEIGMKNRFAGGAVQLNVSAYYNDFKDLLAGRLITDPTTGAVITVQDNGGAIKAKGVEFDLQAAPTDELKIFGTLSLQDSKYGYFLLANRFSLGSNTPDSEGNTIQLEGRRTPWAPSVQGSLGVSYDIETGAGTFTPYAQLAYVGEHYTTGLQQFDQAKQDGYAKIDLRLGYASLDGHWTAQAYVENLTNEAVLQHTIIGGNGIIQSSWGMPRMYGFKVGYRY